jgi:hypothetical protein
MNFGSFTRDRPASAQHSNDVSDDEDDDEYEGPAAAISPDDDEDDDLDDLDDDEDLHVSPVKKTYKTTSGTAPSTGVMKSEQAKLSWGANKVDNAMGFMVVGTVRFTQNGVRRKKTFIFANPNCSENLQTSQSSYRFEYDTKRDVDLSFIFSTTPKLAAKIVEDHYKDQVKASVDKIKSANEDKKAKSASKATPSTFVSIQSEHVMLSRLTLNSTYSTRPHCPMSIDIIGLSGNYSSPHMMEWKRGSSSLAVLHHQAPRTTLLRADIFMSPYKYAFNSVHDINADKAKGLDAWGKVMNGAVSVDMDTGRFWWLVHNLVPLIQEYVSAKPGDSAKVITPEINAAVTKMAKKYPNHDIYSKDVDLQSSYVDEVLIAINPEMDPAYVPRGSLRTMWAVDQVFDHYRVPVSFMEWCMEQYTNVVSDIRMLSPKDLKLTYDHEGPAIKKDVPDVMTFCVTSSTFSPKLWIYTEDYPISSKKQ